MRYFTESEFACKHCGANRMNPAFLSMVDDLRHRCGFALPVTSGYRCPVHNQAVSTTGPNGPHTTGMAVDIGVSRSRAHDVLRHACLTTLALVTSRRVDRVDAAAAAADPDEPADSLDFAGHATSLPIVIGEFAEVARQSPIAFLRVENGDLVPVALTDNLTVAIAGESRRCMNWPSICVPGIGLSRSSSRRCATMPS